LNNYNGFTKDKGGEEVPDDEEDEDINEGYEEEDLIELESKYRAKTLWQKLAEKGNNIEENDKNDDKANDDDGDKIPDIIENSLI